MTASDPAESVSVGCSANGSYATNRTIDSGSTFNVSRPHRGMRARSYEVACDLACLAELWISRARVLPVKSLLILVCRARDQAFSHSRSAVSDWPQALAKAKTTSRRGLRVLPRSRSDVVLGGSRSCHTARGISAGIGLGRPVQRMLQGTDRIPGNRRSLRGRTSTDGTHRAPPPHHAHRRSSGPSLPAGCVVLRLTGTTAASDAHPASHPLPGVTGYRTPRSGSRNPQAAGPGRASPVPAATLDTFRAPYAGEFLTAVLPGSSPLPWPSPRFREARHSLYPPGTGRMSNDAAGFASCYGPHRRSPLQGF